MILRNKISIIGKEFFQVALALYLVLVSLEIYKSGAVTNYLNLNYLVVFLLVSGVMMVLGDPTEEEVQEYRTKRSEMIRISTEKVRRIPKKITTFDLTLIKRKKSR